MSHGLDRPRSLLACAIDLLQKGSGEFSSVCLALGVRHAALLIDRGGVFRASHAFALDAKSLVSMVSSADFWHGTMDGLDVRTFRKADGTLAGCYQLFSGHFRDNITDVTAVLIEPSVVFVSAALEGEDAAKKSAAANVIKKAMKSFLEKKGAEKIDDYALCDRLLSRFNNALEMSDAVLCRLEVLRAVEESIADLAGKDACGGVMCDVRDALYEELLENMSRAFVPPAFCADRKDGAIRLVLFVNEDFDQDLALFHIQKHLLPILDAASEDVDLVDALRGASVDEIMSFVTGTDFTYGIEE